MFVFFFFSKQKQKTKEYDKKLLISFPELMLLTKTNFENMLLPDTKQVYLIE